MSVPKLTLNEPAFLDGDQVDPAYDNTTLDWALSLALRPLQILLQVLSFAFELARPFAPQLVPILIGLAILPLLGIGSLSAGFVVWKTSAVSWEHPIYLQYGDGVPPYGEVALDVAAMHSYDLSLHLVVPAVESNYALGNFMTTLTLKSPSNVTFVSVRKPAIILPPAAKFSLRKPGRTVELDIPLLSAYTIRASRAIALIEVGRRDHWKTLGAGEGRELTVLSATLRGTLRHLGVRGVFTRFPLFTATVASSVFFAITVAMVGVCLLTATRLYEKYEPGLGGDEKPAPFAGEVTNEKPLVRRRSSRLADEKPSGRTSSSRRNSRSFTEVKIESLEGEEPLIRRRMSRPSDDA